MDKRKRWIKFPGISLSTVDAVMAFEKALKRRKLTGWYVGPDFIINGTKVAAGQEFRVDGGSVQIRA